MTDQSKIEWTDFTVNFWEGCQKVGPGCDNCYAEARDIRFTGGSHWGPGAPRRKVESGIPKLRNINRKAQAFKDEHGHWPRVFCSSLSDIFDNAVSSDWRREAFAEISMAPNVRVQLLTKRIGNVERLMPASWKTIGWPGHVGLMITVVNQKEADRDIPELLDLKQRFGIPWVGLSIEPMLGPIRLDQINEYIDTFSDSGGHPDPSVPLDTQDATWLNALLGKYEAEYRAPNGSHRGNCDVGLLHQGGKLDWVICGGESGQNARAIHPEWVRSLRDQCVEAGTAFHFKQWGMWQPRGKCLPVAPNELLVWPDGTFGPGNANDNGGMGWPSLRVGKSKAGRVLDGRTWDQFPGSLS